MAETISAVQGTNAVPKSTSSRGEMYYTRYYTYNICRVNDQGGGSGNDEPELGRNIGRHHEDGDEIESMKVVVRDHILAVMLQRNKATLVM